MKQVIKFADGSTDDDSESDAIMVGKKMMYTQTRRIEVASHVLKKNRILTGLDNDAATMGYKMLRTQILQRMRAHEWISLAVTSPSIGDGKTLTAINMAISLAREVNNTVLLVDGDMRRPSISKYFGYVPEHGLYDYLVNDVPLPEILFNPGIERLVILPGVNAALNSSELLSSPKMVKLADELKTRYSERLVLYDMPPLLAADDLLAFSPNIDALLLVVNEGKTRKDDLKRSMELLDSVNIAGTILNNAKKISTISGY